VITNPVFQLILSGGILLILVFVITWLYQLKTNNAGIVDTVWAVSFPFLTFIYFFLTAPHRPRHVLILILVFLWGFRLAIYLFLRTMGRPEDVRYAALRRKWGKSQNKLMLRFFMVQAMLAIFLSFPLAMIMLNPNPDISWVEYAGAFLWVTAVVGEARADSQLKKFKADPANKGKVCTVGLWNYSRHPNYFFEWLVWVSVFVFALGTPWGFLGIVCPALMLYFLLRVTGIPYTEEQMVKSRGDGYRAYQKTTSAFIPLPKKRNTLDILNQTDS
jgi:steroid 5-alpha reductase family enzyme